MGYQFLHIECYARAAGAGKAGGRTLRDVIAEAEREPAACPHIDAPRPPVLLHGADPREAAAWAEQQAGEAKDAKGRKFRKDGLCMLAGVVSYPDGWDALGVGTDAHARWQAWEAATVAWLREEYGAALMTVLRHEDERHPHLHFYAVPTVTADGRLRIADIHPGRRASEAAKDAGAAKGEQNAAYRAAMRDYQNRYWQSVGMGHGLTRLGPRKRRLTRAAWQAEQAVVAATADALRVAERVTATAAEREAQAGAAIGKARAMVTAAKVKAAEAQAAADAADAARQRADADARAKARTILGQARAEGRRLVAEAEVKAAPMRRLGGWLGSVWSGFRGVERRLAAAADAKVTEARAAATAEIFAAKSVLRAEARQEFGHELDELLYTAARAQKERNAAAAKLAKAEAEAVEVRSKLAKELVARRTAERECEKFRTRWADADNELALLRQPTCAPVLRR